MARKEYSTFYRNPGLESRYQMPFGVVPRIHVGGKGSYSSAEVQSTNFTTPANWAGDTQEIYQLKYFCFSSKLIVFGVILSK